MEESAATCPGRKRGHLQSVRELCRGTVCAVRDPSSRRATYLPGLAGCNRRGERARGRIHGRARGSALRFRQDCWYGAVHVRCNWSAHSTGGWFRSSCIVAPLSQPAHRRCIGIYLPHRRGELEAVPCSGLRAGPHECQYAVLVARRCSAWGATRWYTWWVDRTTAHYPHRSAWCDASRRMVTALTGAKSVTEVR